MKKFAKISFIISGTLLGLGVIAVTVSLALGEPHMLRQAIVNGEFSLLSAAHYDDDWYDDDWHDYDKAWKKDGRDFFTGKVTDAEIADAQNVSDLDIDLGAAALYLKESRDDKIRMDINMDIRGKVQCYVEAGELHLEGIDRKHWSGSNTDSITLYLPKGMQFVNAGIDVGAGLVVCDSLQAADIEINIGAGEFRGSNITANELSAEVSVGKGTIENSRIQTGDFSVDLGELTYQGEITGDLQLNCNIGSAQVTVAGSEKDQNYDLECGIGKIRIGNNEYSTLSSDSYFDNQADKTYDIECEIGTVTVAFE